MKGWIGIALLILTLSGGGGGEPDGPLEEMAIDCISRNVQRLPRRDRYASYCVIVCPTGGSMSVYAAGTPSSVRCHLPHGAFKSENPSTASTKWLRNLV